MIADEVQVELPKLTQCLFRSGGVNVETEYTNVIVIVSSRWTGSDRFYDLLLS